jgi:hypothetical protein
MSVRGIGVFPVPLPHLGCVQRANRRRKLLTSCKLLAGSGLRCEMTCESLWAMRRADRSMRTLLLISLSSSGAPSNNGAPLCF